MATEWREVSIEDIALHIAMGPFGSNIRTENFVTSGVPVIRGTNLTQGRFRAEDFVFLTPEKADELANSVARPGDLVFTHRGTLGQVGIIPDEPFERYVVSQSQMKLTCDDKSVDPMFLYYYFRSPIGQHALLTSTSQTGVPAISRPVTSLRSVRLLLPPMLEQQAISSVLSTLDDKIELNRRMSETLEHIAATVFHSWFVAFDYAEHLENSDLGLIPEGWHVEPIGNLIQIVGGSTPSTKEPNYWDGGIIPWATPKDLSGHEGPVLLETARCITDAGLERISSGLLPKGTLLFSSRAPIGYRAIAGQPTAVNQGFIAVPPGGDLSPTYMYFWAHSNLDVIRGHAGGSTFAEISKRSFRSIQALLPPMELRLRFDEVAGVMLRRCELLARESKTLAELRDALLPKLISGELRVPDAEQLVSEVA